MDIITCNSVKRYHIVSDIFTFFFPGTKKLEKGKRGNIITELKKTNSNYEIKPFSTSDKVREMVCYNGIFFIPTALQKEVIEWYHHYLSHPGINRTNETFGQHLWWPKMRMQITTSVRSCVICQRNKKQRKNTDIYLKRPQKLFRGINYVLILLVHTNSDEKAYQP